MNFSIDQPRTWTQLFSRNFADFFTVRKLQSFKPTDCPPNHSHGLCCCNFDFRKTGQVLSRSKYCACHCWLSLRLAMRTDFFGSCLIHAERLHDGFLSFPKSKPEMIEDVWEFMSDCTEQTYGYISTNNFSSSLSVIRWPYTLVARFSSLKGETLHHMSIYESLAESDVSLTSRFCSFMTYLELDGRELGNEI